MKENSAYIGNLTVRSTDKYIVYGSVRGLVSEHRTLSAADKSLARDQAGCKSQGGYSDASVYHWSDSDGWVIAHDLSDID
jgi:hypothetical protein